MDEFDDLAGILSAASSRAYLLIVFLSIVLVIIAALTRGVPGLIVASILCGIAISAASLSSRRP